VRPWKSATSLCWPTQPRVSALTTAAKYAAFLAVLDRDSRDSLAAIELVLAQRVISSQLIDNLNASIHLRALLTDLFLLDEILGKRVKPAEQVVTNKKGD